MGNLSGSVEVSGKDIADNIREQIDKGVENAADEIARNVLDVQKHEIRKEGAVWRHHLIEGFEDTVIEFSDHTIVSVTNVSDHALSQDRGVSGTKKKRDTDLEYTDKGPPVESLIPWIQDNLDVSKSQTFNG
ncbi:hypothetical protein ACFQL7_20870 [Halocatena marina]|uniref:HK97 gp10 family phage protein n=1 Tax=Halocatena marina TaxID=2934937 RepID=A0ABD5YRB6_9EURY|nr:hypothetical protein [Halocatena marina]